MELTDEQVNTALDASEIFWTHRNKTVRQAYRIGFAAGKAEGRPGAAADVVAERERQVSAEGWTPQHDDEHAPGELGLAGAVYAMHTALMFEGNQKNDVPTPWPWDKTWWKPGDPRRNLVKAAALILAEIERIDRAAAIEAAKDA